MVSLLDQITVMCLNGALFATKMTTNAACSGLVVVSHMKFLMREVKLFCLVNKTDILSSLKKKIL